MAVKGESMNQEERRICLIRALLAERGETKDTAIPADEYGQKRLLRSLFNVRMPRRTGEDFLAVQDEYLQGEIRQKGITRFTDLTPVEGTSISGRATSRPWPAAPSSTPPIRA